MLSEQAIKIICDYEVEMKNAYVLYLSENYHLDKIMLDWDELELLNKKMTTFSMVRFLKEAEIIPNLIGIETYKDIMSKMVPSVSNKEYDFYNRGFIVDIYEKELNNK